MKNKLKMISLSYEAMKEAKKSHYEQFKFYEPHYLNIIKETFVWLFYCIECVINSVRDMKLMPPFFSIRESVI